MEIIGLFFAITFFSVVSCVLGGACVLVFLYRTSEHLAGRTMTAILLGVFPLATLWYLIVIAFFISFLPASLGGRDIVFGDGDEPLPNGYAVHCLSKMPTAGWIEHRPENGHSVGDVAALEVIDSRVAGRYDHTYSTSPADNFFLFDTSSGTIHGYQSLADLVQGAGLPIHLTDTQSFRANRPVTWKLFSICFEFLAFGPPAAAAVWILSRCRQRRLGAEE